MAKTTRNSKGQITGTTGQNRKGVKATQAEKAKYRDYVALMREHNIEPRSERDWLRTYREAQEQQG